AGWAHVLHPPVNLRAWPLVRVRGASELGAPLTFGFAQLVPASAVRVVRLGFDLATTGAAHVVGQHAGHGEHPVGPRPAVVVAAQDQPRRDTPLARRADRRCDVLPAGVAEEPRDKGACTAGASAVTSMKTRLSSISAASPARSRMARSFSGGNPSGGSGISRPSAVSKPTIESAMMC